MPEYIGQIIERFWSTFTEMSPYLLFGFLMAGALSVLVSQSFVERHLGGRGIWPLVKASIFGVPLPLCSCGVIPVSMSLHRHGASKGSTISFLLSTPQTGVDGIFVTLSLLGPVFAIFRPITAFVTGIIGGVGVNTFVKDHEDEEAVKKCSGECCEESPKQGRIVRGLKYGFITLPRDIGRPMMLGLVIAAIITALVEPGALSSTVLGKGVFAMISMMVLGIPVYVCATASVPVAAALIAAGLSPGAALVFLITGPATNAATFVTIWKILGPRTAVVYIVTVVVCALGSGLLLDAMFPGLGGTVRSHIHEMEPSVLGHVWAVLLIAVLVYAALSKKKKT